MKWPWVSRGLLEAKQAECQGYVATLEVERARYDALMDKYDALVRLMQPAEKPTLKPRKADPVLQAISDRAGNNGPLRRQLAKYAMDQRRKQVPDDDIVAVIAGPWHNEDDDEDESAGVPA